MEGDERWLSLHADLVLLRLEEELDAEGNKNRKWFNLVKLWIEIRIAILHGWFRHNLHNETLDDDEEDDDDDSSKHQNGGISNVNHIKKKQNI